MAVVVLPDYEAQRRRDQQQALMQMIAMLSKNIQAGKAGKQEEARLEFEKTREGSLAAAREAQIARGEFVTGMQQEEMERVKKEREREETEEQEARDYTKTILGMIDPAEQAAITPEQAESVPVGPIEPDWDRVRSIEAARHQFSQQYPSMTPEQRATMTGRILEGAGVEELYTAKPTEFEQENQAYKNRYLDYLQENLDANIVAREDEIAERNRLLQEARDRVRDGKPPMTKERTQFVRDALKDAYKTYDNIVKRKGDTTEVVDRIQWLTGELGMVRPRRGSGAPGALGSETGEGTRLGELTPFEQETGAWPAVASGAAIGAEGAAKGIAKAVTGDDDATAQWLGTTPEGFESVGGLFAEQRDQARLDKAAGIIDELGLTSKQTEKYAHLLARVNNPKNIEALEQALATDPDFTEKERSEIRRLFVWR